MRFVAVMCLMLVTGCGASGLAIANGVGLGVQSAALACDWSQTRRAAEAGWHTQYETNPLMGRRPPPRAVDTYFLAMLGASVLGWYVLPKRWKLIVPLAVTAISVDPIQHNVRASGVELGVCGVR